MRKSILLRQDFRFTLETHLGVPKRNISARTKAALAAAKRRGVKLGGLRVGAGSIRQHQATGVAAAKAAADAGLQDIADDLRHSQRRVCPLTLWRSV
jgi:hypothetical protein